MHTMDATQWTDSELAALASEPGEDGDAGLAELLGRHGRSLHRFFFMQFRQEELASDLVQEVFERVIRARDRMPDDRGFHPWLWTIAHNLANSTRRRHRTAPLSMSLDEPAILDRLHDSRPSPRHSAVLHERTTLLMGAIERLEPHQREVIHLKFIQNLPCGEVAKILGISEGTVWSRTHRALVNLRQMMPGEQGHREEGTS